MKKFRFFTIFISVVFLMSSSCTKDDTPISEEQNIPEIFLYNGMLSFESYDHLNSELSQFSRLSSQQKDNWINAYGITTYGSIFRKVMEKEDSISDYMFSLSHEEQIKYLNQPQIHSDIYIESMRMGIIKTVYDDDNSYFDVNLADKTYSDFLNLDGKIRVGDDVLSVTDCEKLLYVDINNQLDIPEEARIVKLPIMDRDKALLKSNDPHYWSEVKAKYDYAPNWRGRNQKRIWAEIEGQSYLRKWHVGMTDNCSNSMHTDFVLKAYSQKRNFWGNFVFTFNFSPPVEMKGTWSYDFYYWNEQDAYWWHEYQFKCGFFNYQQTRGTLLPNYYCYPNPTVLCETSPLDVSASNANGWELAVAPHGILSSSIITGQHGLWWAQAIRMISMDIEIVIDGQEDKKFHFTR